MTESLLSIEHARTPEQIEQVRELFLEYQQSLPFDLCFQSFEQELATLPGRYALDSGRLLLARYRNSPAGCVALRQLEPGICEMKRLYVRPQFRGMALGRILVCVLIAESRWIGYRRMRLDTVGSAMQRAIALYRELGFKDIPAYCENPIDGVIYMELTL